VPFAALDEGAGDLQEHLPGPAMAADGWLLDQPQGLFEAAVLQGLLGLPQR